MGSDEDPAGRVGANDLSIPDLRKLALPFRASATVGPLTLVQLKDRLERSLDQLEFDVPRDHGPIEPPIAERFRNREPGSARHALEGLLVGERHLQKDARASRAGGAWVVSLIGTGGLLLALNFTALGAPVAPLLLFAGVWPLSFGLVSWPRIHAFQSEVVYAWYGYDPPGWVTAYSPMALEARMPTTPQMFDVHLGAGRVASFDFRGKGMVGRRVSRVLDAPEDLSRVPGVVLADLAAASRLPDAPP